MPNVMAFFILQTFVPDKPGGRTHAPVGSDTLPLNF